MSFIYIAENLKKPLNSTNNYKSYIYFTVEFVDTNE